MSHIGGRYWPADSFAPEQKAYSQEELRHINGIRDILSAEYRSPSIELVRYLAARLSPHGQSENMVDRLGPIVRCAIDQCVDDFVNERLRAMESGATSRATGTICGESTGLSVVTNKQTLMSEEEFERCFIVDVC